MKIFKRLFKDFKAQYMLMIPLTIVFQSCFGSLVALFILTEKGDFMLVQLGICILVTMFYNASILAQLKPLIVFKMFFISVGTNFLVLFL